MKSEEEIVESSIIRKIKVISNTLEAGRNQALKQKGLTAVQVDFMSFIASREDQVTTQKDICQYFGIKHTSAINVLTKLEEKGFIEKKVDVHNAKSKHILLTAKAYEELEAGVKARRCIDRILFEGVSTDEQEMLLRLLNQVYDNSKQLSNKK